MIQEAIDQFSSGLELPICLLVERDFYGHLKISQSLAPTG